MLAAFASAVSADDPLSGLTVGDRPEPDKRDGWTTVTVKAASLNQHDLFALRGIALAADRTPMILGGDAAGIDEDGNEVVVHSVIGDPDAGGGDETLDPKRSLLSEVYDGTLAERLAVPRRNLVPKPASLSFAEAACLPTAWLTAYKMLFSRGALRPGETVLIQGAGGGVATALTVLSRAAGLRVWVTSRSEAKRARAAELGAHETFEPGARLPGRADAVMESVGKATWEHSLRSVRPGGRIVVCGATSGYTVETQLPRVFFTQVDILGSTMGTRSELARLLDFLVVTGLRPVIDSTYPLADARAGFERMLTDDLFGKVVIEP